MPPMTEAHKAKMAEGRERAKAAKEQAPSPFYSPNPHQPSPLADAVQRANAAQEPIPAVSEVSADAGMEQPLDQGADLLREIARIRAIRKPLGALSQKLALPTRSGYHRHWFNDMPGRIEEAEANGWSFIKGNDGKPISRVVGSGRDNGALRAYAMELPEVFWLEDMKQRHADAAARVDQLKASPFRSKPGESQASDQGKFYSPTDAAPLTVEGPRG